MSKPNYDKKVRIVALENFPVTDNGVNYRLILAGTETEVPEFYVDMHEKAGRLKRAGSSSAKK